MYRPSDGVEIAADNNRDDTIEERKISAIGQQVGAFQFTVGSLGAALVIDLAPVASTAQVRGATGSAGVALVEMSTVSNQR